MSTPENYKRSRYINHTKNSRSYRLLLDLIDLPIDKILVLGIDHFHIQKKMSLQDILHLLELLQDQEILDVPEICHIPTHEV